MPFEQAPAQAGWSARLALGFSRRGERTTLVRRSHEGPLHIQKALHPEHPAICHAVVVHPPGGVAGGDALTIDVVADDRAHALITTPGATKWYRSAGAFATQAVSLSLAPRSVVEWLPQETIVFDAARVQMSLEAVLRGDAVLIGMETLCLGRTASGERFQRGIADVRTRITRDGEPLWIERGTLRGGDALLESPIGFCGEPVVGTLYAASPQVGPALVERCREERPLVGRAAVTMLPGMLLARYLGPACEPCRDWLFRIWSCARPALAGCEAVKPRLWNT